MNTDVKSSRKLRSIAGDEFYPPKDRNECIVELARRITGVRKVR